MKSVTIVVLLMPSKCTGCKRHWELELTQIYLCHWGVNSSCKVIKMFVPCIFPLIFAIGSLWSSHFFTLQLRPRKWYKASKVAFNFFQKIYYSWFSSLHPENSTNYISRWHSFLNNETLAEIDGHRERLERQEKKLEEASKRENVKNTNVWNRDQQRIWQ